MAVSAVGPSSSGVLGVSVQLPCGSAVTVPIGLPLLNTSTVAPGSAVPVIFGCLSSVTSSRSIGPVIEPMSSSTSVITGLAGAAVSMTTA